jgi:hypothetical protein
MKQVPHFAEIREVGTLRVRCAIARRICRERVDENLHDAA